MTSQELKPRLWILPYGLFPRRVTIYLAEKGLTDKFDIIPVNVTPNGQEAVEGKPPGTLPILEIRRPTQDKPGTYIYQSIAILEYLEDVYEHQGRDMRGSTPEARARVRECMDAASEATNWLVLYVQNASSLYGTMRQQSKGAAVEGLERMHKALDLLERLADEEVPFLVGEKPTLADCVLMAAVQFARRLYGVDLTVKHERVRRVVEEFEGRGTAVYPELPEGLKGMDMKMYVV